MQQFFKSGREIQCLLLRAVIAAVLLLATSSSLSAADKVMLGIDVLESMHFKYITGQRVGLLTHPAGVNRDGVSTIEVLRRAPNVRLAALFGPEHGIYGDEKANVQIDDRIDPRTGLPVYSLYGIYRKPTPKMLERIDVMVIDLQDIGTRSYTYVSCMKKTMEACFELGKTVVVLDRPNPLGGQKADGPPMDEHWRSYVGAFRVPYVHGLTIGEIARMAKALPGWLEIDDQLRRDARLVVIPMHGWQRSMLWPDTGLPWVPTSPAIPDFNAAVGYAMTGLGCQLGAFRHGYGTRHPFRLLTYPGKSPYDIQRALIARRIPGLAYQPVRVDGKQGLYVIVRNWDSTRPTELSFHLMQIACEWSGANPFAEASDSTAGLYNKHVGSSEWWSAITRDGKNVNVPAHVKQWAAQARNFHHASAKYWIYR